mmetsp:Transcript_607/g.801  ORF Transcript_607/g.801 Transcript_607/m.801 type:complete len:173 (+) Transcript_607:1038-1556(+)
MVLHIPVAIDFFYDYLKNQHNPEGIHAFALYIDLRLYDGLCLSAETTRSDIVQMAHKIKQEYLDEGGEYYVELEEHMRSSFMEKYAVVQDLISKERSLQGVENSDEEIEDDVVGEHNFDLIFIEVYAFVLEKLRGYFDLFKGSNAFTELENEICKKERLYEILIDSNLISNQ